MSFYSGKKVAVTGGDGFIGSRLTELLVKAGADVTLIAKKPVVNTVHLQDDITIAYGDLKDLNFASKAMEGADTVFHLAGKVAGVLYNATHPATMITENTALNSGAIEAANKAGARRYLFTSSACGYALHSPIPLREEDFFNGMPEPSNGPYGWAKRLGELQAQAYAKEFGMKVSIVRPFNCYGPRDSFDPETSHVIPGLVRKAVERQNPFVVWGDGSASRAFIYVDDVAAGMMLACEKAADADPINLGTSEEITIRELVEKILRLAGHSGASVVFDSSKPAGQPRRSCSTEKALAKMGFRAQTPLEEGIAKTVSWFEANREKLGAQSPA
ncbi:NAD-dependent epimerase/dehydratase family protein [Candidatus Micrarchaeota archaeon]|nr:NAD-dependent epimerase/dehydratase family protein [Candidatus Micrarchaeota archaeon]